MTYWASSERSSAWPYPTTTPAHLLRRTEFVVRPSRLAELKGLDLMNHAAVVENVLDVGLNGSPPLPDYLT
jgi:hypothetical protein